MCHAALASLSCRASSHCANALSKANKLSILGFFIRPDRNLLIQLDEMMCPAASASSAFVALQAKRRSRKLTMWV